MGLRECPSVCTPWEPGALPHNAPGVNQVLEAAAARARSLPGGAGERGPQGVLDLGHLEGDACERHSVLGDHGTFFRP